MSPSTRLQQKPAAQARRWLGAFLLLSASVVTALLDGFELVATGSGTGLTLAAAFLTAAGAGALLLLAFRRTDGPPNAGSIAGGVAAVGALLAAGLRPAAVFGSVGADAAGPLSAAAGPLLLLIGFAVLYAARGSSLNETTRTQLSGWLFVMPALVLMFIWIYLPAVNALWISLFKDFNYLGSATFTGLDNYRIALRDPLFLKALANTTWYVIGTVPISIFLGVFVAILLNEKIRGLSFFRLVYFLPYITALTAAAAVWSWLYNPGLGLLNWVLGLENFRWTSNPTGIFNLVTQPFGLKLSGLAAGPSVALVAIMIMSIWHFLGYNVVIFLAGLQSISREYYEAARIDGASWWHQLRFISWPLLAPTTFFVLIISLIGSLNVFTQILIMTPTGGVLNDTLSVVMYLYQKGFRDFDFGYASALAFILFLLTLLLTLVQRRLFAGGQPAEG